MAPQIATVHPLESGSPKTAGSPRRHNEGHGRRLTAAFEALEAFPVVKVKVTDSAGENDLILETSPVDDVGEGCVPGQEVSPFFQVSVRREGSGVGPATVQLEVTPPGGVAETRMLRWTRGLFPGESVGIGEFGPGTSLRLDPGGRVPELDEANNNGVLGYLSELTCVPV